MNERRKNLKQSCTWKGGGQRRKKNKNKATKKKKKEEKFRLRFKSSTSLPGGNLVDGLPPVLNNAAGEKAKQTAQ